MLSAHKKYLIKRNKALLIYLIRRIYNGKGVTATYKKAAKEFDGVSYELCRKIYEVKEYPWSPYFDYDEEGNNLGESEEIRRLWEELKEETCEFPT